MAYFHTILNTGEVCYCLKEHGYMMMENPEGDRLALELRERKTVYVPKRYANRCINISSTKQLITFFVFRAGAGRDYGTIETKGCQKLLAEHAGCTYRRKPCL